MVDPTEAWRDTPIGKLFHEYEASMGEAGARTRLVKAIDELHMMFNLPYGENYATRVVSAVARMFLPPVALASEGETLTAPSLDRLPMDGILEALVHSDGLFRVCAKAGTRPPPSLTVMHRAMAQAYIRRGGEWP